MVNLRVARTLMACALAILVQGCGVVTVPGFDYADPVQRTSVPLGKYVPSDPDRPPEGSVVPITPELIQAMRRSQPRGVSPEVTQLFAEPQPYTIGPSDVLGIVVYDHPELPSAGGVTIQSSDPTGISGAPGFLVNSDGYIGFPFIGRVKVGGLTEIGAMELLQNRLSTYIKNPQITVRIVSFRSRRVYVDGDVRSPGVQIITDVPMTLPEAINRAGGVTNSGDRSFVTLTRNSRTTLINMTQMQDFGINPSSIMVQNGDMINVRNRDESKVYVMGEILRPSALLMRNGRLSLNEALGDAGGPHLTTANTAQIYVIRNTDAGGMPTVFHLNASSPTALALADNFPLRARDVVYIDPVPLVQWNRIISLIVPSASIFNTGTSIFNRLN